METPTIPLSRDAIEAYCLKWKIRQLALFGSVLRPDFRPDSDIDVLVSFADDARWSLWDLSEAETELAQILGRSVDLIERYSVECSENWLRRQSILSTARTIYGG